jgi:hypothetical protein
MSNLKEIQLERENELRGTTLNIAIKFEAGLMDIIYFSNAEQYFIEPQAASLKLKHLTFGGKIKRAKELLADYHPDLLNKYEVLFENLADFAIIRNKMAHCLLHWLDGSIDEFQLWDVVEDESKFQFYKPEIYSRFEVSQRLLIFLGKIGSHLKELRDDVDFRLSQAAPEIHSALTSALDKGLQSE